MGHAIPDRLRAKLSNRTIKMDFSLQGLVVAAIAALLLLICSSLIADDARVAKNVFVHSFVDKLSAAAVSPI